MVNNDFRSPLMKSVQLTLSHRKPFLFTQLIQNLRCILSRNGGRMNRIVLIFLVTLNVLTCQSFDRFWNANDFDIFVLDNPTEPRYYLNRAMHLYTECEKMFNWASNKDSEKVKAVCDKPFDDMNKGLEFASKDREAASLLYFMRAMYFHKIGDHISPESSQKKALSDMKQVTENPPSWSPLNADALGVRAGAKISAPTHDLDQRRRNYYKDLLVIYQALVKDQQTNSTTPARDYSKLIAQAEAGERMRLVRVEKIYEEHRAYEAKQEEEKKAQQPAFRKMAHEMVQCYYCKGSGKVTSYSAGAGNTWQPGKDTLTGQKTEVFRGAKDSSWNSGNCPVCNGKGHKLSNPELHDEYHKSYNDPDR
jgi:hypothetical protein